MTADRAKVEDRKSSEEMINEIMKAKTMNLELQEAADANEIAMQNLKSQHIKTVNEKDQLTMKLKQKILELEQQAQALNLQLATAKPEKKEDDSKPFALPKDDDEEDFWNRPSSIKSSNKSEKVAKMSESDLEKLTEMRVIATQISEALVSAKNEVIGKLQMDGVRLNQIKQAFVDSSILEQKITESRKNVTKADF